MKFSAYAILGVSVTRWTCAQHGPKVAQLQADMSNVTPWQAARSQGLSLHEQSMAGSYGGDTLQRRGIRAGSHERSGRDRDKPVVPQPARSSRANLLQPTRSIPNVGKSKTALHDKTSADNRRSSPNGEGSSIGAAINAGAKRSKSGKTSRAKVSAWPGWNMQKASQVAGLILNNQDERAKKSAEKARKAYVQAELYERKAERAYLHSPWGPPPGTYPPEMPPIPSPLESKEVGRQAAHDFAKERDRHLAKQHKHEKIAADANDVKKRLLRMGARYPGQVGEQKSESSSDSEHGGIMTTPSYYGDYSLKEP